jgi:hypothetical protein
MKFFTEHPATVGESYAEHLQMASSFGAAMVLGGIACMIHGIFPALFVKTGSTTVLKLHDRMISKRNRKGLPIGALDFVI